jgi:hypothetical protein
MTKKDALTIALTTLTAPTYANPSFDGKDTTRKEIPVEEVREVITKMIEQLMKRGTTSDKAKEARKAKTAEARSELVKTVAPVLRKALTAAPEGMTAKDLFAACEKELPEGFTAAKVQNVLLREMAPELEKVEEKRKANVYRLIQG